MQIFDYHIQNFIGIRKKMRRTNYGINYLLGDLPFPENLNDLGIRISLLQFSLQGLEEMIKELSEVKLIEALELTFDQFEDSCPQQQYSKIAALLPALRFLRIVFLANGPSYKKEATKLISAFENTDSPLKIETLLKNKSVLKELREQFEHNRDIQFTFIRKNIASIVVNEGGVLPKRVFRKLSAMDYFLQSQLSQNQLRYCDRIKEWRCPGLTRGQKDSRNLQSPIPYLSAIKHICFTELKSLSFIQCQIESLEPLAVLHAPLLTWIQISLNLISNAKSLKKMNSNKIRGLRIKKNKVQELECLGETDWPLFEGLVIGNYVDLQFPQSLNFVAKLVSICNGKKEISIICKSQDSIYECAMLQKLEQMRVEF